MTDSDTKAVEDAMHQDAISTAEKEIIHLCKVFGSIPNEMDDAMRMAHQRLTASVTRWLALVQK